MTRTCSVRATTRTLPPKYSDDFAKTTVALFREVRAPQDAVVLDHMTEMLNRCVEIDVAEFGEEH